MRKFISQLELPSHGYNYLCINYYASYPEVSIYAVNRAGASKKSAPLPIFMGTATSHCKADQ